MISAVEAAERLKITVQAISKMARLGRLPGARKLNPEKRTSPWLLPKKLVRQIEKQRAQAVEA